MKRIAVPFPSDISLEQERGRVGRSVIEEFAIASGVLARSGESVMSVSAWQAAGQIDASRISRCAMTRWITTDEDPNPEILWERSR
jgi:hypothetical protein